MSPEVIVPPEIDPVFFHFNDVITQHALRTGAAGTGDPI